MLRRPSIRAAVTTLAAAGILVGGANLASYAATGHPLILGHANATVGTTALKNLGRGPALSLNSAKTSPPLVVSSSKVVKNLNADEVDGLSASEISPTLTTYRLGSPGSTLSNDQHLFTVPAPAGNQQVTMTGIWTSQTSADSIECLVVDKRLLTDPSNVTFVYSLTNKSLSSSTDANVINGTQYIHFPQHAKLILGCTTAGDTGPVQVVQPINFSFQKISPKVKQGTPTTISRPRGAQHLLTH